MVHAALLLLMLEAANADLVFTISLKRSTQNLQLSTNSPADYLICWGKSGHREIATRLPLLTQSRHSPECPGDCIKHPRQRVPRLHQTGAPSLTLACETSCD